MARDCTQEYFGVGKYHNKKIKTEDGTFDSKYEYEEWCRLKLLERGGVIRNLMRQVPYILIPTIRTTAGTLKQITYYADFVYEENGIVCMVDTKGYETEVFKIKKRLLINQYVTEQRIFIERKKGKKDKIYQKSY
jgi:hypothetical protein